METAPRSSEVWWLGDGAIPPWLKTLTDVVCCGDGQPCFGVAHQALGLVADTHSGLEWLAMARRVAPEAAQVLLVPSPSDDTVVTLLNAGACMVLDNARPQVCKARLNALRRQKQPHQDDRRARGLEVGARLLTTLYDEDETFERLVRILADELHSKRVSVLHVDWDRGDMAFRYAIGVPPDVVRTVRPKIGDGIAGTCAKLGKPLFIDNHAQIHDGTVDVSNTEGTRHPISMTVPMTVKGLVVGVVNITDRADGLPYTPGDIEFTQALMGQAGYVFENAQLLKHVDSLRAFNKQVLDTLGDPLVVFDQAHRIVSYNRRFSDLFGGVAGDDLLTQLEADDALNRALIADPLLPTPPVFDNWAHGDLQFALSLMALDGGHGHRLLFLYDVTARHQMERRVQSAEKMASLGILAAGVAHEINNPISFVKAASRHSREYFDDLFAVIDAWHDATKSLPPAPFTAVRAAEAELDLEFLRDDITQMVKESIEGVERIETIVKGLKSFAHPDTLKTVQAHVKDLLDNALMLTRGKWKYTLELKREDADNLPLIYCVPSQLEQVFMNLAVNAAQAADEWQTLTIRTLAMENGVQVRFQDTCGGIPDHIVDKIFEPFFTTKDIGEGTGLGLAISFNLIETHGGQLSLETTPGLGTTFIVDLPIGQEGRSLVAKQDSRFRV